MDMKNEKQLATLPTEIQKLTKSLEGLRKDIRRIFFGSPNNSGDGQGVIKKLDNIDRNIKRAEE